ncbi:DUF397 domain-containing protein [Sphaerisporangium perillae]|uniref:DUF397 domain-containing protein n=1 Tax=Sphaerisporangium perillae TaxID=2935860 RepID=UPI00200F75EE|nr:DUF397 domain-containing protein [Sphaerisporangium perillae]
MDGLTREFANAQWRKSTFSGDDGSNCVEVAVLSSGRRAVRDSKDRSGPVLVVTPAAWVTFLDHVKSNPSA